MPKTHNEVDPALVLFLWIFVFAPLLFINTTSDDGDNDPVVPPPVSSSSSITTGTL